MDPLMQFFTWQFMLFSLAIAGVTFIIRSIVEYFVKSMKEKDFWEELFLPIFPLILGSAMGWLMHMYPYPDGLTTISGRVIFGLVAGMFSGLAYRVIKSFLYNKLNIGGDNSSPTPSNTDNTLSQDVINSVRDSIQK